MIVPDMKLQCFISTKLPSDGDKSVTKLAKTTSDLGGMILSMTIMKFGDQVHYTQSTGFFIFLFDWVVVL